MAMKLLVGDHVRVISGKYVGKTRYLRRLTLWKAKVELGNGLVVFIYQSSVEKCASAVIHNSGDGLESRQRVLRQLMEAELLRVKQSMDRLENLMREMSM